MTEPEQILNEAMVRWTAHEATVGPLGRVFALGLPQAQEELAGYHLKFATHLLTSPKAAGLFHDQAEVRELMSPDSIARQMTHQSLHNASLCVQAALLVFRHAMLDAVALDGCRAVTWVDPRACLDRVGSRKVELGAVLAGNPEELLRAELKAFLEHLERDSLMKKIDYIYARCRPGPRWSRVEGYVFDRDRIAKLDRMRNEVIHGEGVAAAKPFSTADEEFLASTAEHLLSLVAHTFGLKLDPEYLRAGMAAPTSSTT